MATSGTSFSLSQLLTAAAPTLSTDGQSLEDLAAIVVVVETATPASQTLSGAGSLLCYVYDSFLNGGAGAWARLPAGDLSVSTASVARLAFEAMDVVAPRGSRILWVPSGVTVSAGTTVTVYQLGYSKRGTY